MASVEVTISGVLYDKLNRTMQNVVLIGEASLSGVGVGGGPIIPPDQPPATRPPGHVEHPIWPGAHPEHPIVLPPPGEKPPEIPPGNPPAVTWKPVWHPTEGWIVVGIINPDIPHPTPSKPPEPPK